MSLHNTSFLGSTPSSSTTTACARRRSSTARHCSRRANCRRRSPRFLASSLFGLVGVCRALAALWGIVSSECAVRSPRCGGIVPSSGVQRALPRRGESCRRLSAPCARRAAGESCRRRECTARSPRRGESCRRLSAPRSRRARVAVLRRARRASFFRAPRLRARARSELPHARRRSAPRAVRSC